MSVYQVRGFRAEAFYVSDGDTPEVTFSVETSIRMLAIDTPEKGFYDTRNLLHVPRNRSRYHESEVFSPILAQLELDEEVVGVRNAEYDKRHFTGKLADEYAEYLSQKLSAGDAAANQMEHALAATDHLRAIMDRDIFLTYGEQSFDRYNRLLAFIGRYAKSKRDRGLTYNLQQLQAGMAINYFIYPNLVDLNQTARSRDIKNKHVSLAREAVITARDARQGIWDEANPLILWPFEFRLLVRREPPTRYCADLETLALYRPQEYYKVPVENRLFFSEEFVPAALYVRGYHKTWEGEPF